MNAQTLEARLNSLEAQVNLLRQEIVDKDRHLQKLQDIEDIKRLQCAYGFYLEHWMGEEIVDCFSRSPEVSATFVEGSYYGQEGIRKYFLHEREVPPTFLHMVMQVSPVITVDSDGLHANGRWYGYGTILSRHTTPLDPVYMAVIYEMDYIKEDGAWKILTLRLLMHYAYTHGKSDQGAPESKELPDGEAPAERIQLNPDKWAEYDTQYPSGYIYPFHYPHPVTGKKTMEDKRNATLKLKPNRFRPKQ
jgi:hypothetical protein